jgi:hypothetical protein
LVNNALPTTSITGRLQTRTPEGVIIPYALGKVSIEGFRGKKSLGQATIDSNGLFRIPTRIFKGSPYNVILKVKDTSAITDLDYSAYLSRTIDVRIPNTPVTETSAGMVLLLTNNGKYCGSSVVCWKAQTPVATTFKVKLINGYTDKLIDRGTVEVKVHKSWSNTG